MTVRTRSQLKDDADTFLPDNTSGEISPQDVRDRVKDLADSALLSANAFGTDNVLLRADGTGRDVQVTGITVDDNARMTGHGNMAWQAATESSGEISWDCQNGALLNWYVTASGAAEVQAPDNLPDGWTCLIEIDPDGEDITWAEEYRLPVPEIAAKAVIAILRRGSEYIATVVHEEEAE